MKNIDRIKQMNSKELADFILNIAPIIGCQYTDSLSGLEKWFEEDNNDDK